jgi:DNA (cytosine-5)-methyltransferase 1
MFKILDLFCGAGGASMGYSLAGFNVTGVDIKPQPHYPFNFIQADALSYDLTGYDAIHASPPCQLFTKYMNLKKNRVYEHLNLIPETRLKLINSGLPYIIENVPGAPLIDPIQLCGTSFNIEVRRHRIFESNIEIFSIPCNHKRFLERKYPGSTNRPNGRTVCNIGEWKVPKELQQKAMDINWMDVSELSQAIPPAYTKFIGSQILAHLLS